MAMSYTTADQSLDDHRASDRLLSKHPSSRKRSKWYCRPSNWFRVLLILSLASFIILALIYHDVSADLLTQFLQWMRANIWIGSAAFMLLFIVCTVLMIPGSILTLGAGFVYVDVLGTLVGVLVATTIVWISASIGATLSFLNGRYLLRQCVVSYSSQYRKFEIIEEVVKEYGFSVTFWLRMSSLTPYNVFNYFMGCTSVRLLDYMLANTAMIADIAVFCFVGGSISEIIEIAETGVTDNIAFVVVLGVTLTFSIAGMIAISYYAKKRFDRMVHGMKMKRAESDSFDRSESRKSSIMREMQMSGRYNSTSHAYTIDDSGADF